MARHHRKREGVPLWQFFYDHTMRSTNLFYLKDTKSPRGFGVFARRDVTLDEVRLAMPGWLCWITKETYALLMEHGHPSLFSYGGEHYVLSGPLSMLNHQCDARTGFARPRAFPVEGFTTPSFCTLDEGPSVTRAKLLLLKDVSLLKEGVHPGFTQDQEITITYVKSLC
jgi:hypothetical protein